MEQRVVKRRQERQTAPTLCKKFPTDSPPEIFLFLETIIVVLTFANDCSSMESNPNECRSVRKDELAMIVKLFDSELNVMDALWKEGEATAKYISDVLK